MRPQTSAEGTSLLKTGLSTLASEIAPVTSRPPITGVAVAVTPAVPGVPAIGAHAESANTATISSRNRRRAVDGCPVDMDSLLDRSSVSVGQFMSEEPGCFGPDR